MTAYTDFLNDAGAIRDWGNWLIDLYPLDSNGDEVHIPVSSRGFITQPSAAVIDDITIPASTLYTRRVLAGPSINSSMWKSGRIGGETIPTFGGIKVNNYDGELDQYKLYTWENSRCVIRWGGYTPSTGHAMTIDEYGIRFDGFMGKASFSEEVKIPLRGRESEFRVPLSNKKYRGHKYQLEISNGTVTFGSPAALDITGDLSAEGWFYLYTAASGNVILQGWTGAALAKPFAIRIDSSQNINIKCSISGAAETVTMAAAVATDTFYHYAVTVDGRDVVFYLWDDDVQSLTTETFVDGFSSATRDADVGGTYDALSLSTGDVWLNDSRVWNTVRTVEEVTNNRVELLEVPAECVHQIKYIEGTGATVTDYSATSADGTISGASTTWLYSMEGQPSLTRTTKPDMWGSTFNSTPVLLQSQIQLYNLAGDGEIEEITTVYEGALDGDGAGGAGPEFNIEAADLRAMLLPATVIAAGYYDTFLPRALIRLGSAASLPITVIAKGYNNGTAGYVDTASDILKDIAERRGPKLTDFDTASFTATATAADAECGVYYSDAVDINEVFDFLMGSVGGYWGFEDGIRDLRVGQWTGAAVSSDHSLTAADIVSIAPLDQRTQTWEIVIQYKQNYTAMSETDIAGSIKGAGADASPNLHSRVLKPWSEVSKVAEEIRDNNKQSKSLTIPTAIFNRADAQPEAIRRLDLLKNGDPVHKIVVKPVAGNIKIDETVDLTLTLNNTTYLGLDGNTNYSVLSVSGSPGSEITIEVV